MSNKLWQAKAKLAIHEGSDGSKPMLSENVTPDQARSLLTRCRSPFVFDFLHFLIDHGSGGALDRYPHSAPQSVSVRTAADTRIQAARACRRARRSGLCISTSTRTVILICLFRLRRLQRLCCDPGLDWVAHTNRLVRSIRHPSEHNHLTCFAAGSFLFLGPTGVGKTELAKALVR